MISDPVTPSLIYVASWYSPSEFRLQVLSMFTFTSLASIAMVANLLPSTSLLPVVPLKDIMVPRNWTGC